MHQALAISLGEAIEEFLLAMQGAGRAEKTLRWYGDILQRFERRAGELSRRAIVRYMAARRDELAPASLAGEDRALRRFCAWLVEKHLSADNPMLLVDRPAKSETVPRVATAQTAIALAVAANDSKYASRDRSLVLVLADTGARLSEFLAITMANLRVIHRDSFDYGEAWVIGKGKRRRRLLIGPATMSELAEWIADRPPEAGQCIWWGDKGALTPWGVRQILERLSLRAGIPRVNPHAFRHGCAIDHLENGADIRTLQLILGHSALTTTAAYLKLADKLVTEAHDRISDLRFATLPARKPSGR